MSRKKSDNGGVYCTLKKITLMTGMDYKEILTSVSPDRKVAIWTYNLFSREGFTFYKDCLSHLQNCELIVNKIDEPMRKKFDNELPNITLISKANTHAKILLIAPDIVYLASQNFGDNPDWFQYAVRIQDEEAYQFYSKDTAFYAGTTLTNNICQSRNNAVGALMTSTSDNNGNFSPDYSGISLNLVDGKLASTVNWNQKFNGVRGRDIIICTQTMPDMSYCKTIIGKLIRQDNRICIVAHQTSKGKLCKLQQEYKQITFETYSNFHAKMVLISPAKTNGEGIVWLSSQNFGDSGWYEHLLNLKSAKAYEYYLEKIRNFMGHDVQFASPDYIASALGITWPEENSK